MATRLLVIHRQLVFAVTIKQALEQTGGFAVHPFTKAEAAFDFLRDHPQDIALVDFNLPGRSGAKIIHQLRTLQSDIAIIVTPQLSASDQRSYGVQGSLNSPFSARDLLPLLQNALDEAPSESLRDTTPPLSSGQLTTSNLGDQKRIKRQQMGTTQNLGGERADEVDNRPQTNLLHTVEDKPQTKRLDDIVFEAPPPFVEEDWQPSKPTTKPFVDEPPAANSSTGRPMDPFQTRQFDDFDVERLQPPYTEGVSEPPIGPPELDQFQTRDLQRRPEGDPFGTRILPDIPTESEANPIYTRPLGEQEFSAGDDPVQTRDLGRQDPFGTRPLDADSATFVPSTPPEISSLDQVLQSFALEEPLADEMDTPAVPTKDSDALRQFIATSSSHEEAGSFDDVLGAIEPELTEKPKRPRQVDFEGLVKSMQRNEPERRLPDRQQQLMDFVLTSGMDSVLQEIEKTKTGTLPKVKLPPAETQPLERPDTPTTLPPSNFQKLAQEEPPLPSLEENGTVSDLLVGISDSNFRDVLALLNDSDESRNPTPPRGNKAPTPPAAPSMPPVETDSAYLDDFLQSTDVDSDSIKAAPARFQPDRSFDFTFDYDDDEGETVAGVVLQSTNDNTTTPGSFSLDQLMSDINNRLTSHKLKVKPLPSWDMDTTAFHTPVTESADSSAKPKTSPRRPGEPSFLPEMFPPDEMVPPELPPLEATDVWTTRASEPSLETIEEVDANAETIVEAGYFDEPAGDETAAPIDAALFSGILENETALDDVPRYDSDAESSAAHPIYWDEPLVETDITEVWQEPAFGEDATPEWNPSTLQQLTDSAGEAPAQQAEDWTVQASEETANPNAPAAYDDEGPVSGTVMETWDLPQAADEPVIETPAVWEDEPVDAEAAVISMTEEAKIAQLALNLTQVSLELSAEGTILTRDNGIIAVAGHLSQNDTVELASVINNDWSTGEQGARLRFITLPSSGKEYMLYSTGTDDNLILSMIFAGSTPLRVIRQQGQRLIKALGAVPEPEASVKRPTAVPKASPIQTSEDNFEPYAYVWLVQNAQQPLSSAVTQSIMAGLTTQLSEMNWEIQELQVHGEYIYLLANVPGETPSYAVVRDLKQRAASIAQMHDASMTPQAMWADSYLVLSPGRRLATDEIQEFIDFQRMM